MFILLLVMLLVVGPIFLLIATNGPEREEVSERASLHERIANEENDPELKQTHIEIARNLRSTGREDGNWRRV